MKIKSYTLIASAIFVSSLHAQVQNYFGTSGTLSGNVWSTIPAGPYTSALASDAGGSVINFGNTATFTGATINVAGINATANATATAIGGTITNQGNGVIPIDVATGFTLDFAAQQITTSGTAGYIKNGGGTLAMAGGTYGGGFTLNAGTIAVGGVNAMGDGGTLTINGGTIRSNSTAARDLSGKYDTGIVVAADFTLGDTVSFGALTFSNDLTLGAATRTITARSTGIFSGIISASPGVGLIKEGEGAIVLAGTANTYDGPTNINAGTLSFRTGAADGLSTYTFGAGSAIGLGLGTGGFTGADVVAIFAGTVPASLPNVTINAATNISLDTTGTLGVTISNAIGTSTRGLEKIDGGANLTLTGANQYSGRTVVGSGSALLVNSLGNKADASSNVGTNGTIDLKTGARIDHLQAFSSNKDFNVLGNAVFFGNATLSATLSGTVSTETAGTKTFTLAGNTGSHTFSGSITNGSGQLALTKSGTGSTWTLSGSSSYTGGTTLSGGTLNINHASALGTGGLTMGAANVVVNNTSGSPLTIANGLNMNGVNWIFTGTNDLTIQGAVTQSANNRQITVTNSGARLTLTGNIAAAASALGVNGAGTLVLTGTNNLTGNMAITGGTLEVTTIGNGGVASSLGASNNQAAAIVFGAPTATLRYMGGAAGNTSVTTDRSFTLSNGAGGGATIESSASGTGTLSFNNTVALGYGTANETRTLTLGGTNTGANTFGKAIGNNGTASTTLTKNGSGSWVISSTSNTYSGATAINAGTLRVGANNVLPNASAVSIGAATLDAATFTDTLGTLDATSTATINLGAGAALAFANSSAVDWTGGTLTLTGTFVSGTSLRFGTDATGLDATQLASISAVGFTSFGLDASGFLTATPVGGSPYDTWSGSLAFDADANGDGITNGMAWLLGAASPTASATALLPVVTQTGGNLVLTFSTLNAASRGTATVTLQHSSDLGLADQWFNVSVPESTSTVSGVTFTVTPDGTMNDVIATIPASEAVAGKLFGRIIGQTAP